ncbi:MAG: WD40 repeat domain-containing serine/threonine protein kinase [Oscillospiraceae bacterium]|nr:WD40 repeat domain-containing serine/threonine protein kinase [Oscillospiraceae bacterium]
MSKVISSKYEISDDITDEIGEGGGGKVYKGWHLSLEKDIALKVDKRSLSKTTVENLRREADTLKDIRHTNIPQVFGFEFEDGICYTVMDYIDGESLDKPLIRGERFASPQVIKWARQLLEALCYLHSPHPRFPYGILHSDIKPANIMCTREGDILLIDFNVALALDKDGTAAVGLTPGYASPEHYEYESQVSGKEAALASPLTIRPKDVQTFVKRKAKSKHELSENADSSGSTNSRLDARSDIYGLGASLYHLATGRLPAKKAIDVTPLTQWDCAPALAAIINKAMSPNKDDRFQTAAEMLEAFIHIRWNIHWNDPRAKHFRMIRASTAAILSFLLLLGTFTTFTGLRRMQWDDKVRASVEASLNAYSINGDKTLAIKLALEAVPMPINGGLFTSPISAGTMHALATALGVYDLSDGFKLHKTIYLPSAPMMAEMSPGGATAVVVYAYEAAVIDLDSGKIVFMVPMAQSVLAEARFLSDTTLVFAGLEGLCAYSVINGERLWLSDIPATAIAVSADGGTVAAISDNGGYCRLYDAQGNVLCDIGFGGKAQRTPSEEEFTNPRDNLFALSGDGKYLAASFADGSLAVFDTGDSDIILTFEPKGEYDYVRFEGGFLGDMLAFSMTSWQGTSLHGSDYAVIDMSNIDLEEPMPLFSDTSYGRYGVIANQDGIFISLYNTVVRLDPNGGELRGIARADSYVKSFDSDGEYSIVAWDGGYAFSSKDADEISRFKRELIVDITLIKGDFALIGGRDSQELTVLKLERNNDTQLLSFDGTDYPYLEARVNADGTRIMLFRPDSFRIYSNDGKLLCESSIPNNGQVRDQQHSKNSGNLAVMYEDALLIYSGHDGRLIFEETGLRSVFYAPYGVSILDDKGQLHLIDLDSGTDVLPEMIVTDDNEDNEAFAAFCGFTVDSSFLTGAKLIGAVKIGKGYFFVVAEDEKSIVYDETSKKRFEIPFRGSNEAHFTETAVVISPISGTPAVYSLKNGKKIADLEKDAYLTYITEMGEMGDLGEYIVSQYISTDGEQYGVLLDSKFQPIASLPWLCDVWNGQLVFANWQDGLRYSRVYNVEELVALAKAS